MMKTVCLIRNAPALRWFVNRVHRAHGVDLVVVEEPNTGGRLIRRLRRDGPFRFSQDVARHVAQRLTSNNHQSDWIRFFGDAWQTIDSDIDVMVVADINSPEVARRLTALKPDLILDHGTSIVSDSIIETAPLALNLHWGLSPYYRGTFCTEWALINHDPRNIGVTIHRLAKAVDGGDILGQARASVSATDTPHAINMQLTALGTEIIVDAMHKLAQGQLLSFHPQDFALGYLTRIRQFTPDLSRHLNRMIAQDGLGPMLKRPARRAQLPIHTWTANH